MVRRAAAVRREPNRNPMTGREGKSRNADKIRGVAINVKHLADLPLSKRSDFLRCMVTAGYMICFMIVSGTGFVQRKGAGSVLPVGSGVSRERLFHCVREWETSPARRLLGMGIVGTDAQHE